MEGTQKKAHVDGSYELTDNLEVYGSFSFAENWTSRGNSLYPDVSFAIIGTDSPGCSLTLPVVGLSVPYLALQRMMENFSDSTERQSIRRTRAATITFNYLRLRGRW